MKLREHIDISRRAVKLLHSLSRRYLICLILRSIVTAALPYVPIRFSARLIDALVAGAGAGTLSLYAGLTVGISALLGILGAWLRAQAAVGAEELNSTEEWRYAEKAMRLAYASVEDREVVLLRQRVKDESQTGYNVYYLTACIEGLVTDLTRLLASGALVASFFAMPAVSGWAKAAIACGVALNAVLTALVKKKSSGVRMDFYSGCVRFNALLGKLSQYLDHYTTGKDIRLYAMDGPLAEYLDRDVLEHLYRREQSMRVRCARLDLLASLIHYALQLGVYLLLISAALAGGISVGSIAQYVSAIMLLLTAVSDAVGTVQLAAVNHTYLKRFFSYFDIPNPMYRGSLSVEKRDDNAYDIEFRNVSFRYPNTDAYALRHVSLKFRVGSRLAVVGMNGSGKTTFIKLLCRLYDPTEGVILLNGVDIRKYDYDEYLSVFSVVFQDFRLFAFPLGQNVAAGAEYDRGRAAACLREAGFGQRLDGMPEGLDTVLYQDFDPEGIEISGGEAQKIAIARALYKNAPFIVLDEPTAALDPVSEYEVYRKFNEISGGRTAIYISHRLASCRFCDEVLVFHEGAVVQRGTHAELLAADGGKYAELWHAQAQYYTEAEQKP